MLVIQIYFSRMLLLYIILSVVSVCSTEVINEGFCSLKGEQCDSWILKEKYVFYVVNQPEGFNLRRDVYMRFAIMMSDANKRQKWSLVLPPWYHLYHWKSTSSTAKPLPWSAFFDVNSLKNFAPVVELKDIVKKLGKKSLILDRIYVLQHFEDAFENGVFREKWEISQHCNYYKQNLGYNISAKETLCIKFQGKISKLWEVIALHPKDNTIMFYHGEIPLHDTYGTKLYWDCRKSMIFNKKLTQAARDYIRKHFDCEGKCDSYVSVHWRRRDFARARKNDVPSIIGTAKQINNALKKNNLKINKVFIATDAIQTEIQNLENELYELGYTTYFYTPNKIEIQEFEDGGVAIIEQIICSHAAYFIGTHESTFSFRIQEEREILGLDSLTTFNRLCPDSGLCEKPSKWTIVQ